MNPVWIVDDDRSIRWVLEKALARESIPYSAFSTAQEALDALDSGSVPQVLVSDIRMPGESGLSLLEKVKTRHPNLPVIIMTAYSDLDSAVAAFQGGAFEYLPKPFDVDHAIELVRRAIEESMHQASAPAEADMAPEILGKAASMQDVFRAIGRLAQSHATVLINGESGTGKELVARALHRHTRVAMRPSSRSIRPPSRATCSNPNCSATSAAHSPAPPRCVAAASNRLTAARCFSTKSATCRRSSRRVCCACCPMVTSTGWADIRRSSRTCGSSRPRTRIWRTGSSRACSGKICFTGST
jgi:FixJ family two-component response regulator